MNILNKITIRNLKLNKKRTISTIIGIILSVALICAVSSMAMSFRATLVENAINETGYYHIELIDVNSEDIKTLENNRDIDKIYRVNRCGYANLENSQNEDKPYVQLYSMNEETFNNLKFNLIKGRFPQNSNEIVISKSIIDDAKVDYEIGKTIELNVGTRKTLDNYELSSGNPYEEDNEKIEDTTTYNFEIVGIMDIPNTNFEYYSEPSYTIISTNIEMGKNNIYISLKSPKTYKTSIPEILGLENYDQVELYGYGLENLKYQYNINTELLRWEVFAFSDSTVSMLYSVIGVVICIIIFTSVFCIRNSFAIATTEKIKMYSMLASVGATKKQIKKNVITEGLILGLIGIPLGILSGFLAVFILIKIVNFLLGEYLLAHIDGLVFEISILPILLSIVLGFLTIYLSTISSAIKASKVTPIEGLRGSKEIKLTGKKLKVPKAISKVFKIGGELAYKNLKRSKKKYRTTVISISVSIFVFITMNTFITNVFGLTDNYYEDYDYNLIVNNNDLSEDEINNIISLNNIEEYHMLYDSVEGLLKIKDLSKIIQTDQYSLSEETYYDEETDSYITTGEKYAGMLLVGLNEKDFKEYVEKIGANYDEVKSTGILCDEYDDYDYETGKSKIIRRYNYSKGDIIQGEYGDKNLEIKVGAVSDIKPYGIEKSYYMDGYLVVNMEEFKEDIEFILSNITIQSSNATQLEDDIENIDDSVRIFNIEESAKEQRAMILVVKIFLYGFIAVITLIGVTNIFNTITSNMELRQKEFAMLKSIGMTKKEFNKMINLETIFYGTKSWLYGTILGLIGTFAIYKAFSVKIEQGIYIPFDAILISAIFVFIFVYIIMKYSIKKINKQNTIETIRNENI